MKRKRIRKVEGRLVFTSSGWYYTTNTEYGLKEFDDSFIKLTHSKREDRRLIRRIIKAQS